MHNDKQLAQLAEPHHRGEAREIAAIDLGSNSFHMIVARIINGSIQVLSRLKQKVRLADGLDEHNVLSQEAIERGVNCLALFAERLQGFAPEDVNVVGTYTLRRAVNNDEFLRQAAAVFPYPINIISGQTEAKTIYAGVCHTQPESGRKLVIDIGGGSTEMIIGDDFTPLVAESRHMGCVSFAKKFFPNGEISKENATLDPNGIITAERLQNLIERTLQTSHFEELNIAGLNPDRVDVFVPGLAILSAVFDVFGLENMRYSDGALREGVIYSLEQNFQVSDIRTRTALGLAEQFNLDLAQADRVANSAKTLIDQYTHWQKPHLADEMKNLLIWAARLLEVGIVINHRNVQKHSAYILQNMELPGFDREQQRLLVNLVRYHTGAFKNNDLPIFARYADEDVLVLLLLLRISVILNKSRQATDSTDKINLRIDRSLQTWELTFEKHYLDNNPLVWNELRLESNLLKDLELSLIFN